MPAHAIIRGLGPLTRTYRRVPDTLDLTKYRLGDHLCDLLGEWIYQRFVGEEGFLGPFDDNQGLYGGNKAAEGVAVGIGWYGPGIRGGDMSDHDNFVRGPRALTPDSAVMGFGWDSLSADKGCWFENGSVPGGGGTPGTAASGNPVLQPPRPFWGMTDEDADALMQYLENHAEWFIDHL